MIAYVALLIGIVGMLMFVLASNPKLVRIGEVLMFCGLFVFVWVFAGGRVVKLF